MSPIQMMLLGAGGAVATKPYIDDVFSTFLYEGNGYHPSVNPSGPTSRDIVNGIDFTEGGLAIFKTRNQAAWWQWVDTEIGATNSLATNSTNALDTNRPNGLKTFNNNGFTIGYDSLYNIGGVDYDYLASSFRKAPGFFDVVKFTTSNSTNQRISHQLGSIPGMIIIKNLDTADNWLVYHRETGRSKWTDLSNTDATTTSSNIWGTANPTSTDFGFNSAGWLGNNSYDFIAYVFAGGESNASEARSVEFDGNNSLSLGSTSDFSFPYDFTVEFWALTDSYSNSPYFCDFRDNGSDTGTTNRIVFYTPGNTGKPTFWVNGSARITATKPTTLGTWSHYALVRNGSTTTMYINGTAQGTYNDSTSYGNAPLMIGQRQGSSVTQGFDGKISNFRIFRGVAVYTSSGFKPSTTPLTGNALTKLLCCNDSSVTGKTYGGTITANGSPSASTDSPFDDPAGFVFGENENQNVIKSGSYVGAGWPNSGLPEVNLGFEPQWVLIKRADGSSNWRLHDSMRGIATGGNDAELEPNASSSEATDQDKIDLTSTGFKLATTSTSHNADGETYIFLAIRRSDGYCGKPVELGTGALAMDTGAGSSTIPNFDSGFPVDFAILTTPAASGQHRLTASRLTGTKYMRANATNEESSHGGFTFDSNVGWGSQGDGSTWQSWMWKRHAGFDVVTYKGDGVVGHQIPHSMNKSPEMIWIKNRDRYDWWAVGHKGLNGGTNPWNYQLKLNEDGAEAGSAIWNYSEPTSTHFAVGGANTVNYDGEDLIAMLFASVDGISKVGSYSGSDSEQTISTGFAPRFVIIKRTSGARDWVVLDTLRGWGASSDNWLKLNTTDAQGSYNFGAPTSTGFTLTPESSYVSGSGNDFIYYAHS